MLLSDRMRRAAAAVRTSARRFAAAMPPRFPGVGLAPPRTPFTNERTEARVASRNALEGSISIGAGPMLDRHSSYPATQLDPLKIEAILREADLGIVYRYCDLAKQVLERDAHLFGIDRGRRQAVCNKPFLIQPKNETRLAKALALFMREAIDNIGSFPDALYQLQSANCVGYAAAEIIWARGRVRFPGPKGLVTIEGLFPRSLQWVHGKHFQFTHDSDEPLLDLGPDGVVRLPPHKFIFHRCAGDGIAATRGYIRSVVWLHFLKHCGLRDWAVFLHLYGIPQLYGQVERGLWNDPKMREVLRAALVAYGTGDSAPILPDGLTIEAKDGPIASGAGDAHGKLVGLCNYEQSKAVQGETLTSEAGQSGSYKLGEVHADSKHEVTIGDALTLASDLRADLFTSVVELNAYELARQLGEDPDELLYSLPRCEFWTDRQMDPKARAETIKLFAEAGMKISVSQIRRENSLDTPTSDEDVLPGKPIPITSGGAVAGTAQAAEGVVNPKPDAPAQEARTE